MVVVFKLNRPVRRSRQKTQMKTENSALTLLASLPKPALTGLASGFSPLVASELSV